MLQKPKCCFRTSQAEVKHSWKIRGLPWPIRTPKQLLAQCCFGTVQMLGMGSVWQRNAISHGLARKVTLSTFCQKSQAAATNSVQVGFCSSHLVASPGFPGGWAALPLQRKALQQPLFLLSRNYGWGCFHLHRKTCILLVFATLILQEERKAGKKWEFLYPPCDLIAIVFLREVSHNLKCSVTLGNVRDVGHLVIGSAKKSREVNTFQSFHSASRPWALPRHCHPSAGRGRRAQPLPRDPRGLPPRRLPRVFLPVSLPPPSPPSQWRGAVLTLPQPPRSGVG